MIIKLTGSVSKMRSGAKKLRYYSYYDPPAQSYGHSQATDIVREFTRGCLVQGRETNRPRVIIRVPGVTLNLIDNALYQARQALADARCKSAQGRCQHEPGAGNMSDQKERGGRGNYFLFLFYRSYDLCPMTHDRAIKITSRFLSMG